MLTRASHEEFICRPQISFHPQRSKKKLELWQVRELAAPAPLPAAATHVGRRQGGGRTQSSWGMHHLCSSSVGFEACCALLSLYVN